MLPKKINLKFLHFIVLLLKRSIIIQLHYINQLLPINTYTMKKQIQKAKSSRKPIIVLKNVERHYSLGNEIVKAVDGIDISIYQGEFVAIVGPSGSGKSTAMNLVGALDLASKGEIYLDGINIERLSESELASLRGKKIGFVFQP